MLPYQPLVIFFFCLLFLFSRSACAGDYLNSAHGNSSYGVERISTASLGYSKGNCAHCHEQHASIGGEEPEPARGSRVVTFSLIPIIPVRWRISVLTVISQAGIKPTAYPITKVTATLLAVIQTLRRMTATSRTHSVMRKGCQGPPIICRISLPRCWEKP